MSAAVEYAEQRMAELAAESARAALVACSECGATMTTPNRSGCCSARCRAAKSRRVRNQAIRAALADLDALRLRLADLLE